MSHDLIKFDRLRTVGIIGLNAWERSRKQEIWIDAQLRVDLRGVGAGDSVEGGLNYGPVAREMAEHAATSERYTIEALATDLAGICLHHAQVIEACVEVSKPAADPNVRRIAALITRKREDLLQRAFVIAGSNVDPESHLEAGIAALAEIGRPIGISGVYETPAVGAAGQPNYLNAGVVLRTCLPAPAIRNRLKAIEKRLGREGESGPAGVTIDLDLCLLENQVIRTGGMEIPDPDILTHGYLALILSELDPGMTHPETNDSLGAIADRLCKGERPRLRKDVSLGGVPQSSADPAG